MKLKFLALLFFVPFFSYSQKPAGYAKISAGLFFQEEMPRIFHSRLTGGFALNKKLLLGAGVGYNNLPYTSKSYVPFVLDFTLASDFRKKVFPVLEIQSEFSNIRGVKYFRVQLYGGAGAGLSLGKGFKATLMAGYGRNGMNTFYENRSASALRLALIYIPSM